MQRSGAVKSIVELNGGENITAHPCLRSDRVAANGSAVHLEEWLGTALTSEHRWEMPHHTLRSQIASVVGSLS